MSRRKLGPLLCGGLMLLATAAFAVDGNPIGGVGVGVETSPGGIVVATGTTDRSGGYVFNIPGGNYRIVVKNGIHAGTVLKTFTQTKAGPVAITVVKQGNGVALKPSTSGAAQ